MKHETSGGTYGVLIADFKTLRVPLTAGRMSTVCSGQPEVNLENLSMRLLRTFWVFGFIVEGRGGMQNSIESVKNAIKSIILEYHPVNSMAGLTKLNQAHLGDVRYDDELKLISVLPEEFLEVGSLRIRSDGRSDGVSFLESTMWMAAKPFAPVTRILLPEAMVGIFFQLSRFGRM